MQRIVRYLLAILGFNLAWEVAQVPLYTIWTLEPNGEIAWAVLHCTMGDVLIAGTAMLIGWIVSGRPRTGDGLPLPTVLVTTGFGLVFTILSEWRATQVTHAWAYSPWMPVVPWIEIGLTPILQWIVLPPLAIRIALGAKHGICSGGDVRLKSEDH